MALKMTVLEPSPDNSSASAHQKSLTEEEIMELLGEDESNDGSCNMVRSDGKNGKIDKKKPDLVETGGTEADDIGLDEAFVEGSPNIHDDVTQEISEQLVDGAAGNSIVSDDSGRASDDKPTVMNRADNFQRGVVGLMNIGNTCFMNAGLQCLLNTPALVEFFGTRSYSDIPKVTNPRFKLLRCFFWIFNKAWGYGSTNGIINLSQFKDILGNCHSDFKGSGQHDCQEFLALLLDTLDDQLRVLHSMEQQIKASEDATLKIDDRKENVRPGDHDGANNSTSSFGNHNGVVSETVKQGQDASSSLQNGDSWSGPLRTVPNRQNLKWKGGKFDMKLKEKYIPTLPRSRLFSLPDFGAVKVKSPLFEEVGGYNEENNCDSSSWDSLARKGHSLYASPKSESKERPPTKRIRLSEADDTSETGPRRKLDFEMRGLKITDDDDQHHGAYHGMQEVPVLVSETVKHAVSAVVRSEVPGHSVTKDKKLEPTFSADAAIHDNSEAKPNDNQTVITKAFEGIMTSTITCSTCSHSSSVNEPFIYLTLRIPQNTTRNLRINFVSLYNDPSNRREEYTVAVPLYWTVRNIKEHMADSMKSEEHTGRMIRIEDLYVTYVWDHAIMEFLADDLPVGHVNETKDIYVYEVNSEFHSEEAREITESEGFVRAYEGEERRRFEIEHKFFRPAQPKRSRNSYRKGKTYDCAVCWESSPCLRMNFECECILCENCLQKCVEVSPSSISGRRYKCLHCTETVSFSSLGELTNAIGHLPFRVVFINKQYSRTLSRFGYPYVIRFPMAVQGQTLYGCIHALLEPHIPFDLISLRNSDGGCASCSNLYCQGCELPRFGTVHLKPGSIIGVCYKNLPDSYIRGRNVADMATESSVHNMPHYTYEPSFNIDECLEEFSRVEKLDSDWFCAQCKKTREASKSLDITRCPDYLIIHLSRFQFEHNTSHKLDNQIKFNGLLDLSTFVSQSCRDKENVKYELYGCVCHSGSASYGHYTAYVKNPLTQEWTYCNDSTVSKEDPDSTVYSSVYVLFYSREGIQLDPGLEFVQRSSTNKSPATSLVSPVRNPDVRHNFSSSMGLSRRKRPQVISTSPTTDKNNRSEAKVPRRNFSPEEREFTSRFASKRDSPVATVSPIDNFPRYDLKNEILMDWDLDETQMIKDVSSRRNGGSPVAVDEAVEEEKCEHFIGRDDHLPYYRGYNPSSTNGSITFTIDPDLLPATGSSSKQS